MKEKKIVIFDFDGTIVDSKAVYYNAILSNLIVLGLNRNEIIKAIEKGRNLKQTVGMFFSSRFKIWRITRRIRKAVLKEVKNVRKCKDIDSIKEIRVRKILVSNSINDFAKPVLVKLGLKDFFDEAYYGDDFSDKAEFIREYINKNKIAKIDTYYVGDRVADVAVAERAQCNSIIVSGKCSWDDRKEILNAEPDFVVEDIKDIKEIVD